MGICIAYYCLLLPSIGPMVGTRVVGGGGPGAGAWASLGAWENTQLPDMHPTPHTCIFFGFAALGTTFWSHAHIVLTEWVPSQIHRIWHAKTTTDNIFPG